MPKIVPVTLTKENEVLEFSTCVQAAQFLAQLFKHNERTMTVLLSRKHKGAIKSTTYRGWQIVFGTPHT